MVNNEIIDVKHKKDELLQSKLDINEEILKLREKNDMYAFKNMFLFR